MSHPCQIPTRRIQNTFDTFLSKPTVLFEHVLWLSTLNRNQIQEYVYFRAPIVFLSTLCRISIPNWSPGWPQTLYIKQQNKLVRLSFTNENKYCTQCINGSVMEEDWCRAAATSRFVHVKKAVAAVYPKIFLATK